MDRVCIVKTCEDCPYFDNEYYTYNEFCGKLHRKISLTYDKTKGSANGKYLIPEDCPLPVSENRNG